MMKTNKRLAGSIVLFLYSFVIHAQIINDYFQVTAMTANTVTVTSTTGINVIKTLAIGDTVLIIQMQGAIINETNTASFGNITNGNAGNFELGVICDISGTTVSFKHNFVRAYTPATGSVQLVSHGDGKLLSYTVPAGGLTATPWNGNVGGVLFIKAQNSVTLGGNLNVNGQGFRGGLEGGIVGSPGTVCNKNVLAGPGCVTFLYNNDGCNGATACNAAEYFYPANPHTLTCGGNHASPPSPNPKPANNNDFYAAGGKGEGIAKFIIGKENGRGAQANGGGAGQAHNSGGAGGANIGTGGNGGDQWLGCTALTNGGVGGKPLTPGPARIFMGGGGGAGHGNYPNGHSTPGGNGGGIVMILTNTLTYSTARTITANGNSVTGAQDGDSEGGGGAGGTVYLDVATITNGGNALTISATGGVGGNSSNGQECIGPGGGGGGGYVISRIAIPAPNTQNVVGGAAGIVADGPLIPNWKAPHYATCGAAAPNYNFGATNGTNGSTTVNAAVNTQRGITLVASCTLPIRLFGLNAELRNGRILISWFTSFENNNKEFVLEKSVDGQVFEAFALVNGQGNSNQIKEYQVWDHNPATGFNYYRLKQIDYDGTITYSNIIMENTLMKEGILKVYPQPLSTEHELNVDYLNTSNKEINIYLITPLGQQVYEKTIQIEKGLNELKLDLSGLNAGIYYLQIVNNEFTDVRRIELK